jgi:hypothetical protein
MDEQPKEQLVVPIPELDEAALLSELASLFHDLNFVVNACDSLDDAYAAGGEDSTFTQAYWTAAVIAYIRCFTTGIRLRLTESDLEQLPFEGEVVEFHRLLKDMRDKHIAHSVNPFEDVQIGAVLSPDDSPSPQVEGIATLYMRHVAGDRVAVQQLRALASDLAKLVAERAKSQKDRVLAAAQGLNVEGLYERQRLRVTAPGPEDAGRRR